MKKHLNTLFVTTQGAYLAKEGETEVKTLWLYHIFIYIIDSQY